MLARVIRHDEPGEYIPYMWRSGIWLTVFKDKTLEFPDGLPEHNPLVDSAFKLITIPITSHNRILIQESFRYHNDFVNIRVKFESSALKMPLCLLQPVDHNSTEYLLDIESY